LMMPYQRLHCLANMPMVAEPTDPLPLLGDPLTMADSRLHHHGSAARRS